MFPDASKINAGLAQASPLLLALGQQMQAAPQNRDPNALNVGIAQMTQNAERERLRRVLTGGGAQPAQGGTPGFNPNAGQGRGLIAQMGLPPEMQTLIGALPPEQGMGLLAQMMTRGPADQPAMVQEYEFARQNGYDGTFMDYQRARGGRDQIGLQPVPMIGPDGRRTIGQLSTEGRIIPTQMPEGYSVGDKPIEVDTGSGVMLVDPYTGQPSNFIPRDSASPARDRALGAGEGEALAARRASAPKVMQQADRMLADIGAIETDPNLGRALGWGSILPTIPGYNSGPRARVEQLQGQAFLQAFESLKGGGAITEIEGRKAEQAIARLQTSQTEGEFRAALNDLRGVVQTARERAIAIGSGGDPFEVEKSISNMSDAELKALLGIK